MSEHIAHVLSLAVEAAYGRRDDIGVWAFLSSNPGEYEPNEYGIKITNGEIISFLYTVDECIEHIKGVVD